MPRKPAESREPESWLVTGANRGIGLAFARALTARGDRVVGTARRPAEAIELAATGARVERLDVSDPESIEALARAVEGVAIDVLVHNAGRGGGASSVSALSFEELEGFFRVNAIGPMLLTRALLGNLDMGRRRVVVGITSGLASISEASGDWYAYRASKAALDMFARNLAAELARRSRGGISIVLSPGWVRTDMGGSNAPVSPERSVAGMLQVVDGLTSEDSGKFLDYRGREQPW